MKQRLKYRWMHGIARRVAMAGIAIDLAAYAYFRLRANAVERIADRLDIGNM